MQFQAKLIAANWQKLYIDPHQEKETIKSTLYFLIGLMGFQSAFSQDILKDSLFIRSFGTADYRASEFNYSVAEDENGILFFANENGILEYDGSTWRLHPLPDYSHVITVRSSPDGRLYVGGQNEFGYMTRDSSGTMNFKSLRSIVDTTFIYDAVWQIVFHKGSTYFQTYEGIIRYDGEVGHQLPIQNGWMFPSGNDLLVSVIEKGIGRFRGDSIEFLNTEIRLKDDNPQKPLGVIGSEKIMPTEYNGLYLFDTITYKTRKWEVPANDVLIKEGIYTGTEWGDDLFLFSTITNGLVWINIKGEVVRVIGKEAGLKSKETRSFFQDSKGNLWIPGYGIHHLIWPERQNMSNFSTLIRSMDINDLYVPVNSNKLKMASPVPGPIRSLVFSFATPGFDETDLQYSYKLEGFDQDWSNWTNNTNKHYTNLEGGTYVFNVKARLIGGPELTPATFEVHIPILWYRTGWAKVVGGLVLWFLIIGIYKFRTTQLKNQNRKLESIVEQRTGQLRVANDELVKKNLELDQFVRRVSHDLVAPIKSVKALMEITREETVQTEIDKCFDMMQLSLDKQEEFVKRMLDQAVNYREVKYETIHLHKICQEAHSDLKYYEGTSKMTFKLDFPENFTFTSDPDRVKIVISNLFINAIKYRKLSAEDSIVTVRAKNEGKVIIEIEDNGLGIEEKALSKIFEMFVRASEQSHGSGLGLFIVQDMMRKMGGSVSVGSEYGKGTTFTLNF